LAAARWFGAKGRSVTTVTLEDAFLLDSDAPHVLAIATLELDDRSTQRYTMALTGRPLRPASDGDGAWRAVMASIAEGRTIGALARERDGAAAAPGPVTAALVCRPAQALPEVVPGGADAVRDMPERALGADQSNTSVVIGERLLLKVYRRLEAGLNPELELVAFLAEVARFPAVAPLAGYAEVVSSASGAATVAVAQGFVAEGADAYESIAESLVGWLLAPGQVSVEFATEVAAELGFLTAGMHAALSGDRGHPEFVPRAATRAELRSWAHRAQRQLVRAVDVTPGKAGHWLRERAAAIVAELTVFEALPTTPRLTRVHGDFHLGQVLVGADGYWVVDFEGEPLRPLEERRAHGSPLRDVASMLRSLDHVGRSAGRRAAARNGRALESPGLDLDAWLRRAPERFVDAYRTGLREAGAPIDVDPALLRAFEIEKETYEFIYASTYLPTWLWAPTEGMRALLDRPR
jgi:maltose alpha-D-glucosyltransferase/alpha-amylase